MKKCLIELVRELHMLCEIRRNRRVNARRAAGVGNAVSR